MLFVVQTQVRPAEVSGNHNYRSHVQKVNSFIEQDVPLTFPGQRHLQGSQVSFLDLDLTN